MNIQVNGKQINIGQSLTAHVQARLGDIVSKYAERAVSGHAIFCREGHGFRADCHVHLSDGKTLISHAVAPEIYECFESAALKLEKRLRRHKRKKTSHHGAQRSLE